MSWYWFWRQLHCRMEMQDWGNPNEWSDDAGYCIDRYTLGE